MTSDDICGAECVDGTECHHPAGSCPVPSHSDPTAENPHGRDFSLSEDDHADILDAAQGGMSKSGCARAAGVDEKNLRRYLEAHPHFRRAFMRARHEGEKKLVSQPLMDGEDAPDMDGQHARFLLSTSFDYVKTEKRELEHSGEGGGGIVINMTDDEQE